MSRRWKDTKALYPGDKLAEAVSEAGGVLVYGPRFAKPEGENGGCGAPTHVAGTNGGTMPCGSPLTRFGKTEPYFCGACAEAEKA